MSLNVVEDFFNAFNNMVYPITKDSIGEENFTKLETMFKDFDFSKETNTKKLLCCGVYLKMSNNKDAKVPFIIGSNLGCGFCSNYVGLIFEKDGEYGLAKYYYEKAIESGIVFAMSNLGYYYSEVEKDYEKMKYYYKLAISKGNINAMHNLGYYYKNVEKDYEKMKFYYEMAISKGNITSMYNLGYYYSKGSEKDYEKMKYYYEMAIEKGCEDSFDELCQYYSSLNCKDEIEALQFFYKHDKLEEWLKNLKYDLENCDDHNFEKLISYLIKLEEANEDKYNKIKTEIPYLTRKLVEIAQKKIDILDLHFKYAPTTEGYEKAKKDFLSLEQK